jgi:hypothetical protein
VKSAAANAMAAGLAAVLLPAGSMPKLLKDEDVLPWQAIHSTTYMVRISIKFNLHTPVFLHEQVQ